MKATIPLVARKGRASYLGERSAGHQDPGATSSHLLLQTVADTWAGDDARPSEPREEEAHMADYVGALDQGTTSTRFMIFDHGGKVVGIDQKEHEQIFPKPGWVEHDPAGGLDAAATEVIDGALEKASIPASDLAAVGITNQRETTVVWDRATGEPIYNALVWQDTRTAGHRRRAGRRRRPGPLPREDRPAAGDVLLRARRCGGSSTTSRARVRGPKPATSCSATWTPGASGTSPAAPTAGRHVTDVTNASRTMLMDLETLDWDDELLAAIGVPRSMLPSIEPSSAGLRRGEGHPGGHPRGG